MDAVKNFVTLFLTEECHDEFFVKFNFGHVECFKQALSKTLGTGIILGSVLVKIPQILKLYGAKSGKGMNIFSLMLELFAITANTVYSYASNFPFSSWGEGLFLLIQTSAIAALVLFYNGQRAGSLGFLVAFASILGVLVSPVTPLHILWSLQAVNVPVIIVAKLMQAHMNYKNGSTGQLSAVTVFLLFLGSVARIFTSIQETGDSLIILTYVTTTVVNGLIAAQILYYWNSGERKGKKGGSKKKRH